MKSFLSLAREAFAVSRAQPVGTALTLLAVAGMIVAILLTTGRTVGAEREILSSIDAAGTRTIIIKGGERANLNTGVLDRISHVRNVEWFGAFGPAQDYKNLRIDDGASVAVRHFYGPDLSPFQVRDRTLGPNDVVGSDRALALWGMLDSSGAILAADSGALSVVGEARVPDFMQNLEPLAIAVPGMWHGDEQVSVIVIVTESSASVESVSSLIGTMLSADDPQDVTFETSARLAQLRGIVAGQLGDFSRGLVLALMLVMGSLVAVFLYGLVMMRRKDFGRRRALGATRGFIVALLMLQTLLLAITGSVLGFAIGLGVLLVMDDPVPDAPFILAVGLLSLITAVTASAAPAIIASTRDPIKELRVP